MNSTHPIPPKKGPGLEAAGGEKLDTKTLVAPLHEIKPCRRGCRHVSQRLPEVLDLIIKGGTR